jgi:predicted RNA-binding protein with PUA-like domain
MNRWLMKSEPDVYPFEQLLREGVGRWDGVRNYQARNYLRDQRVGDPVFFYHSSCALPGIVGLAEIVKRAEPDPTQFDASSEYFDAKSKPDARRWDLVTLKPVRALKRVISLAELKADLKLAEMVLLQRGSRLSVQPVTAAHWARILKKE